MASIVDKQLRDGSRAYLVRFRLVDGRQRSRQFKRKREAEQFANLVETERAQGTMIDPRRGRITVGQWWEQWWPTVTNLRPTTRARDEYYFHAFVVPRFGDVPIGKLDRTDVRGWVAQLVAANGAGLAPATVQKIVQILNKTMRAALEDRLIPHNPVDRLPLPRIEHEEMRHLDHDGLMALADAIDHRYRGFVLLGGYGGLRLGEMLGLRWGNVDLLRGQVRVAETLIDLNGHLSFGSPKTKQSVRTVVLPRFVCDELAVLAPTNTDPTTLVFRSPDGHPVRQSLFRRRFWVPAVEAAGVAPLRIHDLRHTAVSLWIAEGANPKQVAVRAGHTSVSVVLDRYGHLYPQHDDELMDRLQAGATAARRRSGTVTELIRR